MTVSALITGAAKRLGKAMALHLARSGYNIALHYNTAVEEAKQLESELSRLKIKCELFQYDLNQPGSAMELFARVNQKLPNLELLINNASLFTTKSLLDTEDDLFDQNINIHIRTPFILMREFGKTVKEGQIINMIDSRTAKNQKNEFAYTLSKKALVALTELAAVELAPNIRVNAILPGSILQPVGSNQASIEHLRQQNPLKRMGSIPNVTSTLQFLIDNDFLTRKAPFRKSGCTTYPIGLVFLSLDCLQSLWSLPISLTAN